MGYKGILHTIVNGNIVQVDEGVQRISPFEDVDFYTSNRLLLKKEEDYVLKKSKIKLEKYKCEFTETINYEQNASHQGLPIDSVDLTREFYAYRNPNKNHMFFRTSKDIALLFIKLYNEHNSKTIFEVPNVNFETIELRSKQITTSWFSQIGAQVKAQGLMGYKIQESLEYENLKETSEISSLTVEYYLKSFNSTLKVIVSKKGTIYIQSSIPQELDPIELLYFLYEELIEILPR